MATLGNTVTFLPGAPAVENRAPRSDDAGHELADIFAGADVGLALFDADLSLLACNGLYRLSR
jgi:hypothetical protein